MRLVAGVVYRRVAWLPGFAKALRGLFDDRTQSVRTAYDAERRTIVEIVEIVEVIVPHAPASECSA